ncbi:hypothetical protein D3C71_2129230 [compost metagenome]
MATDLAGETLQLFLMAPGDHHLRALRGKASGDALSHVVPSGGAQHDGALAQ